MTAATCPAPVPDFKGAPNSGDLRLRIFTQAEKPLSWSIEDSSLSRGCRLATLRKLTLPKEKA